MHVVLPERCLRQDELNDLLLLVQQSWLAWLQWELMLEVVQLVYLMNELVHSDSLWLVLNLEVV